MEASFPLLVTRCACANKDIRSCNNINTLSLRFGTIFGIHLVVACMKLDPGIHMTYAFSFVLKTGCDRVVSEPTLAVARTGQCVGIWRMARVGLRWDTWHGIWVGTGRVSCTDEDVGFFEGGCMSHPALFGWPMSGP